MLWTPKALRGRERLPRLTREAGQRRREGFLRKVKDYGRLARSDEYSSGIAVPGSESGHALQVRRGTTNPRIQAWQPLALQEVKAGPVDGRQVKRGGTAAETQDQSCGSAVRVAMSRASLS